MLARRRPAARLLIAAAVCLMVGGVVNLAVAWAASVWGTVGAGSRWPVPKGYVSDQRPPALLWHTAVPRSWPPPEEVLAARGPGLAAQHASYRSKRAEVIRAGWPLLCIRSTIASESAEGVRKQVSAQWRAGVELAGRPLRFRAVVRREGEDARSEQAWVSGMNRRLPLEPIPVGAVGGSIFYAVLALAIGVGCRRLRAVFRRRDGRCGACGYSRAGLPASTPCPECGASAPKSPLPSAAATSAGSAAGPGGE